MTPQKGNGRNTFREWVRNSEGKRVKRSTGTDDAATARDVRDFLRRLRRKRRWDVLDAIVAGTLSLPKAYDADNGGTLDELVAQINDVDLSPLVTVWNGGSSDSATKYLTQVRRFIPEAKRFPRSALTRGAVSRFLDGLEVSDPTRNRYRAAIMQFAKWLVQRDVLETNPVRDAASYRENDPRTNWMTWPAAQKLADKLHEPYRTLILVLAGTGMEIGAALVLTAADVDRTEETIHARGTKKEWRDREIRAEDFAWAALIKRLGQRIGEVLVFEGVTEERALDAWKAIQKAPKHTLHDLRHTYAVNALRSGLRAEVVAHQLGHKDATMVRRVYGRYVPRKEDYERPVARKQAPVAENLREVKRAT